MEKIQISVSGARVRSAQRAEKGVAGAEEGGKVAMVRAEGEEVWNWRRRRRLVGFEVRIKGFLGDWS